MDVLFAAVGGALIGAAASLLLITIGRIAGISGILGGSFAARRDDLPWRIAFLAGLLAVGVAVATFAPGATAMTLDRSLPAMVLGGLLVGFGTRMGNGCTSGHGVCGVASLSPRSLVAVVAFMAAGVITASAIGVLFSGRL